VIGTKILQPVLLLLVLLSLGVHAQVLRDPTQPPSELGAGPGAAASIGPLGSEGMAVIVRDGKPFLVVGTRLYAPGQSVGAARIERITETEVWLREGKDLRKLPRFTGIQRSAAATSPACGPGVLKTPKATKSAKKAPPKKAPPTMSDKNAKVSAQVSAGTKASTPSSNASPTAPCGSAQP